MHNAHGFVAGLAPKSKLNVEVINEHLPSCPHRMPLDAIPTDVSHWFPGDLPSETRWFYMIQVPAAAPLVRASDVKSEAPKGISGKWDIGQGELIRIFEVVASA